MAIVTVSWPSALYVQWMANHYSRPPVRRLAAQWILVSEFWSVSFTQWVTLPNDRHFKGVCSTELAEMSDDRRLWNCHTVLSKHRPVCLTRRCGHLCPTRYLVDSITKSRREARSKSMLNTPDAQLLVLRAVSLTICIRCDLYRIYTIDSICLSTSL